LWHEVENGDALLPLPTKELEQHRLSRSGKKNGEDEKEILSASL
jgi:hypothetical protein